MPDQPDDTLKQQRRSSALPPFFAPRTTRPTTPSQSGAAAPPRRTSHLFTPPGVQKQRPAPIATPLASRRVTPFAMPVVPPPLPVDASFEPPPLPIELPLEPPPLPELDAPATEAEMPAAPARAEVAPAASQPTDTPNAEIPGDVKAQGMPSSKADDAFVIEQYESPPISLRATGEQGVVSDDASMSFQVYDDATRVGERGARPIPPEAGGLEIERTEVVFGPPAAEIPPLEVESFWRAPMATPAEAAHDAPTPPLGNDAVAGAPAAPPAPEPIPVPSWLEDVPAVAAPYPAPDAPPPAPLAPAAASEPDDADEALAEAFAEPAPNESVPRWATPRAVPAVAQDAPPDAWAMPPVPPPPDELAAALAWPDSGLRARTPAMGVAAQGERADTSHELAASAEGWPLSVAGRPGVPDAVAEALERIAQRVRAGDVPLPADVALAKSDESALALTLAALLRAAAAPRA